MDDMTMRKRKYNFHLGLNIPFYAYPNTMTKEHDELAKEILRVLEAHFNIKMRPIRDCKTGRFRKL